MSCKCAHPDGEGRYNCDVSGDGCMFFCPDSKACAVIYGEGPDADNLDEIELHCKSCHAEFMADRLANNHECPECGSKQVAFTN